MKGVSLKRKCHHFDEIFITGCTESCQNDNFQCSQWRKFHQNDDISVSVIALISRRRAWIWNSVVQALPGSVAGLFRLLDMLKCRVFSSGSETKSSTNFWFWVVQLVWLTYHLETLQSCLWVTNCSVQWTCIHVWIHKCSEAVCLLQWKVGFFGNDRNDRCCSICSDAYLVPGSAWGLSLNWMGNTITNGKKSHESSPHVTWWLMLS